ncbi:MAG: fatty acid desaturase [Acidobacteriota bacterium]|nr:fatty acid desaturase [Acidobacteriota bacterium]
MEQSQTMTRPIDWKNVITISGFHVMAVVAVTYMITVRFSVETLILGAVWFTLCGLSITAGYHRLFTHRAYKASRPLEFLYLLFGAASLQNSALTWATDHRVHHAHTDHDIDPYSTVKGFWWAHIGWIMRKSPPHRDPKITTDLAANPLVRLQDRYYYPLAIAVGSILPLGLGALWGDALGALLVAGFLRTVLQWHATFCINSLAHTVGSRHFGEDSTARDFWPIALITFGEGFHNFHHTFQSDYRNGVKWYHYDPTKWFVRLLSFVGVTWDLKRAPAPAIARVLEQESGSRTSTLSDQGT